MTAARLCSLNVWNGLVCVGPGRTGGACFICVCLNLKLLFVLDAVWGRNLTLVCCPNTLRWRWRLRSLNVFHDSVLALDEQQVRLYYCLCAWIWIWTCYSCSIQYDIIISPARMYVMSKYTKMVMTAVRFMFVERCHIGTGQTGGTFLLVCAWIWSCYSCSMQ